MVETATRVRIMVSSSYVSARIVAEGRLDKALAMVADLLP